MRPIYPLRTRLSICIFLLLSGLLTNGPHAVKAVAPPAPGILAEEPPLPSGGGFVPGELLVGFYGDALLRSGTEIDRTLAQLNVQSSAAMQTCAPSERAAESADAMQNPRSDAPFVVRQLVVPHGSEESIRNALTQLDAVAFAMPNWTVRAADLPALANRPIQNQPTDFINDPLFPDDQWYLQNIHAEEAWTIAFGAESASPSLETVRVAIIDSGINFDHPEFSGRILQGQNYVEPGEPAEDDYGHGSHVAGLMGALINNNTGIAGVARAIVLDPYKALDQNGEGSISDVVEAICDATDAGADIINLSLAASDTPLLQNAVQYADEQGVLLIAAAGNLGGMQVQWPADYPEVVAVAATTLNNTRASYSNRGSSLEIAAPGGDTTTPMLSTWRQRQNGEPNSLLCPSYTNNSDTPETYCYNLGTSMAAALVSGAAALVWSVHPSLTPDEVRLALRNTTTPLDAPASSVGQGLLNVEKAVRTVSTSNLLLVDAPEDLLFVEGAAPYTTTITFENPSLEPLAWEATFSSVRWISPTTPLSGTVSYNHPGSIAFQITPAGLTPGAYGTPIQIVGTRIDGTQVSLVVNLNFTVMGTVVAPLATLTVTGGDTAPVLQPGAEPYVESFLVENSSPSPLAWEAMLPPFEWITPTTALTGTVSLNAAAAFSATVDPSDLPPGRYGAAITVLGTREDASQIVRTAHVYFTIASGTSEPPNGFSATGSQTEIELPPASSPFTTAFTLQNTGTETITWRAELPPLEWITATSGLTGTLAADNSAQFVAAFEPESLAQGTYEVAFTFIGTGVDSSVITQIVPLQVTIRTRDIHLHLPLIRRDVSR